MSVEKAKPKESVLRSNPGISVMANGWIKQGLILLLKLVDCGIGTPRGFSSNGDRLEGLVAASSLVHLHNDAVTPKLTSFPRVFVDES